VRRWTVWCFAVCMSVLSSRAESGDPRVPDSIVWTGEQSMYSPRLWSHNVTLIQKVFTTAQTDVFVVYLSAADSNVVTINMAVNKTFRVCQPTQFSSDEPASWAAINGHPGGWQQQVSPNDTQCKWEQFLGNWANQGGVQGTPLTISHNAGGKNEFLVVSEQVGVVGGAPSISDEEFARMFAVPAPLPFAPKLAPAPRTPQPPPVAAAVPPPIPQSSTPWLAIVAVVILCAAGIAIYVSLNKPPLPAAPLRGLGERDPLAGMSATEREEILRRAEEIRRGG